MSHALERVKISRIGRSLPAAALFALAVPAAARAQDVRPDTGATLHPDTTGTHVVKRGDTLWDLANAYLGDAYLWPEIYRLNTDQIDDPLWIYPGEVLRLPGRGDAVAATPEGATPAVVEAPRNPSAPTVFATRTQVRGRLTDRTTVPPSRVPLGDFIRAPYFERAEGPRITGRVLFSADLPGIARTRLTSNFGLYDQVFMVPPAGSVAAAGDRFLAFAMGGDVADVGSIVVPTAVLHVLRAPRDGEPALARVVELYGQLNAEDRVVPLDTVGSGANQLPVAVPRNRVRTTTIRSVQRPSVLPSYDYYVMFDLAARDGMKAGDEIEIYREREVPKGDDTAPVVPEIHIAKAQVVKVTAYGATARITSMDQPVIREGEHVRVTARMPD